MQIGVHRATTVAAEASQACSWGQRGAQGQTRWDLILQIKSILLNSICSGKPLEGLRGGMAYIFNISLWLVCVEYGLLRGQSRNFSGVF